MVSSINILGGEVMESSGQLVVENENITDSELIHPIKSKLWNYFKLAFLINNIRTNML